VYTVFYTKERLALFRVAKLLIEFLRHGNLKHMNIRKLRDSSLSNKNVYNLCTWWVLRIGAVQTTRQQSAAIAAGHEGDQQSASSANEKAVCEHLFLTDAAFFRADVRRDATKLDATREIERYDIWYFYRTHIHIYFCKIELILHIWNDRSILICDIYESTDSTWLQQIVPSHDVNNKNKKEALDCYFLYEVLKFRPW